MAHLTFVCMAAGAFYGMADTYVRRLFEMLGCHVEDSFTLICVTDRPRTIPAAIRQIDCGQWRELRRPGMRPTTLKLGLFNPDYIPAESFFYLDLTLVLMRALQPLVVFANSRPEGLVIVNDWHYPTYNSCVMRIRPATMQQVYRSFVDGDSYRQKTLGDQDFIRGAVSRYALEGEVALFPASYVASFKLAVRTARAQPAAARRMIDEALIVKFHGSPRMHRALNPLYAFFKYGLGNLRYGRLGLPFSMRSIRANWRMRGRPSSSK
jgi:hypothetical protein